MEETPFKTIGAASKAVQTALLRNISPKKDYIIDNIKDILREGGLASGLCPAAVPSLQSSLTHGAIHTTFSLLPTSSRSWASRHASIQKAPFALKEESRVVTSGSLPHCSARNKVVFCCSQNSATPPSDMSANAAEQLV